MGFPRMGVWGREEFGGLGFRLGSIGLCNEGLGFRGLGFRV